MFVVLVLVASVGVPIYGAVDGGFLGFFAGMYWGLGLAAIGLTLLCVTLVVESIRRAKAPKRAPTALPAARVASR
jgi:hypothetical protein